MKHLNIAGLVLLASLTIFNTSCSKKELDEVNRNRNNPTDVQAKFILTDIITSTAFSVVSGDISLYSSVYVEHEAGVWGQMYNAETRTVEPVASTTYNNSWNSIYNNIKALKIVIDKTSEGGSEEGNDVTCGIGKVLLAYNLGVLTDFFGDVPFTQTGIMNPDGSPAYMQPTVDKQSALYSQIQVLLDEAIGLLAGEDDALSGPMGSQDFLYGGNSEKWIKAAYALKARYLMHTLKISADKEGDLEKVLDYIDQSFADVDDEMKFAVYDGGSNVNPLFGFSNSRDALGASESLIKKFKALNDPRGKQAFMEYTSLSPFRLTALNEDDALEWAAPNGTPDQQQYTYSISMAEYAPTAPTMMFSYHELLFLKAEALIRLERAPEAEPVLQSAIVSAFANLEVALHSANDNMPLIGANINLSETVANNYFTTEVQSRFNTDPLKETMLQKYLAFYGASGESTEAYNDYRRLKALGEQNFIELENPLNNNRFPLRFTYGNSDVLANPNVTGIYGDGSYVYTENVWWAGGSR